MIEPHLFDIVELLIDIPAKNLFVGMQGTIVEQYEPEIFEIEFSDEKGQTLSLCTLKSSQFFVVWQSATQQGLNPTEQLLTVVNHLSESRQQEVLDFAKFLYQRQQITS